MTNQTTPLTRLARHVDEAGKKVARLRQMREAQDYVNTVAEAKAQQAEDYARQAFAVACGHRIGTTGFTRALAEALADNLEPPIEVERRLLIQTANAIACTLATCAPVSMKPENNPGKRSLYHLEQCRDQIADLLDPQTERRATA